MQFIIFETSHLTSLETVLMYINFMSHYERMLCTAKESFGVADAAEGLTCRRQCRATWEGWMKREIILTTLGNKKCET
jgi:hypothetical protein